MNLRFGIVLVLSIELVGMASSGFAADVELTAKQRAIVDQLGSLYSSGDSIQFLKAGVPVAQRANSDQIVAMDERLDRSDLPSLGDMLANARMNLVLQGFGSRLPKPSQQELLLSIPRINDILDETIEEVDAHEVMQNPLPTFNSLEEYKRLLWDVHVLVNELQNAQNVVLYGKEVAKASKQSKKKLAALGMEVDYDAHLADLEKRALDLAERRMELRLDRLQLAGEILHDSTEFRPRFMAAWSVDLDGGQLTKFFTENKRHTFGRPRLNEPELAKILEDEIETFREKAGDLTSKSRLFHRGLHWWFRGRYGRGPYGNGMLKSQAAVTSPTAVFGLYMPTERPKPTDPYELSVAQVPQYDRRHHDAWRYEYRRVRLHRATETTVLDRQYQPKSPAKKSTFNTGSPARNSTLSSMFW